MSDEPRTAPDLGAELHDWVRELYPIDRSLTGPGVRETLAWIGERVPLDVHEVPTGTPVLDWEVPREWRVREAYLVTPDGRRVADFAEHNLHLVGYSAPFRGRLSREELEPHLHSLPAHPDWIPYRTSYWRETWGFCLPHRLRESLPPGQYEVVVDTELAAGSLSYGEVFLPGDEPGEVLFSCHVCHPSLANDNLASLAVAVALARELAARPRRRWGYRFVFAPGTIGAITWLARNRERVDRVRAGLVLANLGDPGAFVYKRSRRGDTLADRAVAYHLAAADPPGEVRAWEPWGYDERQYCSPGFDLPVGRLTRTPHGEYPEYHTSADDPALVAPASLAGAVDLLRAVVGTLEGNARYRSLAPYGEPQLGRRGLYGSLGGGGESRRREHALLWVLSLADGGHDLLAVAERSGLPFAEVRAAADLLLGADLLAEVAPGSAAPGGR